VVEGVIEKWVLTSDDARAAFIFDAVAIRAFYLSFWTLASSVGWSFASWTYRCGIWGRVIAANDLGVSFA